jgi:hypothetical protein
LRAAALGERRERGGGVWKKRERVFLIATVTWPLVFIVLGDLAPKQSREILIGFGFFFPNNSNSIP